MSNVTKFHTPKDPQFHIVKAERNEECYRANSLGASKFNEWGVVLLFYISVHYVDAVLSQDILLADGLRDPEDHFTRIEALSKCSNLTPIKSMYLNLYNRSRDARYRRICFPDDFLGKLEIVSFKPVRKYLRKYLRLPD